MEKRLIEVGAEIRQLSHKLHPAVLHEKGLPMLYLPIAKNSARYEVFPFLTNPMRMWMNCRPGLRCASTVLRRRPLVMSRNMRMPNKSKFG